MLSPKPVRSHVFPRAEHEWYVEPPAATEFLLRFERFDGRVLDPCCGMGNVVTTLRLHGIDAIGTDLVDRTSGASWFKGTRDFLTSPAPDADHIVMNPPYGGGVLAEAFIRRALAAKPRTVAAYLEARFLFGETRALSLYRDAPPSFVYPEVPRQSCPPGEYILAGHRPKEGRADHVWLVWRRDGAGWSTDTRTVWPR